MAENNSGKPALLAVEKRILGSGTEGHAIILAAPGQEIHPLCGHSCRKPYPAVNAAIGCRGHCRAYCNPDIDTIYRAGHVLRLLPTCRKSAMGTVQSQRHRTGCNHHHGICLQDVFTIALVDGTSGFIVQPLHLVRQRFYIPAGKKATFYYVHAFPFRRSTRCCEHPAPGINNPGRTCITFILDHNRSVSFLVINQSQAWHRRMLRTHNPL